VFVNKYNRRVAITTCKIVDAGASGVCFVGDPKAVRSPLFEYGEKQPPEQIDRTPGPKTDNYPAKCRVHDCLIHGTGRVEKQSAGVEISMSEEITVSHCSIYEVPRAGSTSATAVGAATHRAQRRFRHGARDGRSRFVQQLGPRSLLAAGHCRGQPLGRQERGVAAAGLPPADRLRNNRWRCDHGWDIDLDDGSTNFTSRTTCVCTAV
jgi:hypothetical protein